LDSCGSSRPVSGSYKHGNEFSRSTEFREVFGLLGYYWLLKKGSSSWIYLVGAVYVTMQCVMCSETVFTTIQPTLRRVCLTIVAMETQQYARFVLLIYM
jgi:hypothetical protein